LEENSVYLGKCVYPRIILPSCTWCLPCLFIGFDSCSLLVCSYQQPCFKKKKKNTWETSSILSIHDWPLTDLHTCAAQSVQIFQDHWLSQCCRYSLLRLLQPPLFTLLFPRLFAHLFYFSIKWVVLLLMSCLYMYMCTCLLSR